MTQGPVPTQDPLAQLRDIHLPTEVSAWPPAPSWWLLALVVLLVIGSASLWWWRRHRANAWRREALSALQATQLRWQNGGDAAACLQAMNALMKRVALRQFPNYAVAELSGDAWDAFLDRQWRKPPEEGFTALGVASLSYQPAPAGDAVDNYISLARRWLCQLEAKPC